MTARRCVSRAASCSCAAAITTTPSGHTRRTFPGSESFGGRLVHPQALAGETLDYAGKQVVVIGSGATAVTLVPELARTAAHVTMLQRSPTYVVSRPAEDAFANWLRAKLPGKLAYSLTRWRNVLLTMWIFYRYGAQEARRKMKEGILKDLVRAQLGPDYDVDTHFTPKYNPWDQRLCLVPDADLFDSIKAGTVIRGDGYDRDVSRPPASSSTSGRELPADIVVTATGLER